MYENGVLIIYIEESKSMLQNIRFKFMLLFDNLVKMMIFSYILLKFILR